MKETLINVKCIYNWARRNYDSNSQVRCTHKIIIGNFNFPEINWINWVTNTSENHCSFRFLECIRDNFLEQFITKPTRWRDLEPGNVLDLVLADSVDLIKNLDITTKIGKSDHLCIELEIDTSIDACYKSIHTKNYNRGNYIQAADELSQVNWSLIGIGIISYRYHKLRKAFSKFYRRHYELISKFNVGLKSLLHQGLSEPEFYGDLVYKFKKIRGMTDFSDQFRKIIIRYKRIGYNLNVMRQSACLVINPITVDSYAALFNCTPVDRASDSMMAPT